MERLTQVRLLLSWKPLRDRVGMPAVDFDRNYSTEADYPFHHLNKYLQAVRRERRIEQGEWSSIG